MHVCLTLAMHDCVGRGPPPPCALCICMSAVCTETAAGLFCSISYARYLYLYCGPNCSPRKAPALSLRKRQWFRERDMDHFVPLAPPPPPPQLHHHVRFPPAKCTGGCRPTVNAMADSEEATTIPSLIHSFRKQDTSSRGALLDALVDELNPYEWRKLSQHLSERRFQFDIIKHLPTELQAIVFSHLEVGLLFQLQCVRLCSRH
jgi:hypothetical protein